LEEQALTVRKSGQINVVLQKKLDISRNTAAESAPLLAIDVLEEHSPLLEIEEEMNHLVGMDAIKQNIKEIYAWITVNARREEKGLKSEKQALHMMFKGNPGTGKTTMARLIGKMFAKMNVLSKGHLIEAERADLVGEYIGHTAIKTRDLVKKACGGILFIDEAYSLGRGGEKDFGREAIDALVKQMEDKQHEFVLILAGYPEEMDQFLKMNPGLASRFQIVIDFPNYSIDQLMEINDKMLLERQYFFSQEAMGVLRNHLEKILGSGPSHFSNGRYIRNIIEKSIRMQALRVLQQDLYDRHELMMLRKCDLIL